MLVLAATLPSAYGFALAHGKLHVNKKLTHALNFFDSLKKRV
jgi:hypothetical protein